MANQWYYKKDGQRQGPISDSQLRKLVETGGLTRETLIWKEGMASWKKASALKGLFRGSDPSTPPPIPRSVVNAEGPDSSTPPPIPTSVVNTEEPDSLDSEPTPQGSLSFGESARLTGSLAATQTELTKIHQVSIPAQHLKIGQHVYNSKHEPGQHSDLFSEIYRLNNAIREIEGSTKNQAPPNTIGERAKSLGTQTANAAKLKTYQMQLRLKLIALGKAVFESGKTPEACRQQKSELENLLSRASTLNEEMTGIKGKLAEQGRGVAQAGRSLLSNTAIVVATCVFCVPIGLFLIWSHPKWDRPTKLKWTGVSLACFIAIMILGRVGDSMSDKPVVSTARDNTIPSGILGGWTGSQTKRVKLVGGTATFTIKRSGPHHLRVDFNNGLIAEVDWKENPYSEFGYDIYEPEVSETTNRLALMLALRGIIVNYLKGEYE